MTTKIKTGIRLKVNPEQSLHVQNICFANGIYWNGNDEKELRFTQEDRYYINIRPEYLTWNELDSKYSPTELEEIDAMLFIRTNGTCDIITYPAAVKFRIPDDLPKEIKKRFVDDFAGQTYWNGAGWSAFYSWDGFHNSIKKEVSFYEVFPQYSSENLEQETKINPAEDRYVNSIISFAKNENKEDEESEMVTEEKVYKNAKEYLVEKGLYDQVIHNCLNVSPAVDMDTFSSIFIWNKTKEGVIFWGEVNKKLQDLDLSLLINEILEDVAFEKASANTIPTLKPEDIPLLMEGLELPKEEPEQPKQYLVYVEGKQAPKKVHNSLKSAQKEANRLAKKEVGYVTYVVEVVNKYKGTVSVEEIK